MAMKAQLKEARVVGLSPAHRGQQTRDKILDSAELLFASRGFNGVALRDITETAGVENALASYHFKTKERLFAEVIRRRSEEHRLDMLASLEAALQAARPGLPTNQSLVKAYAEPALEKISRGANWAAYIKITVGIQNLDREDTVSLLTNSIYDDTIKAFIAAFVAANRRVTAQKVYFALYFLHGALIHLLSQGRTFERLIDEGLTLLEGRRVIDELAEFFAAALQPGKLTA